ncbi:MAG TPA: hypothetical protein VLF39_02980 [Candidatus Saccharimonadales bacterium]|nr:hypothetical protein [Candidatus Saccharimonadales bacterium]
MISHFAYIDAGTGSLFIQALIGVGLAVTVTTRRYLAKGLYKIKSTIARSSVADEE